MSNHPECSQGLKGCAANPTSEEIRLARETACLTQRQAAESIYRSERNWQQWEGNERKMDPALFELFRIKAGLIIL
jgi:DNA-binding transcriptional regulator YiaG